MPRIGVGIATGEFPGCNQHVLQDIDEDLKKLKDRVDVSVVSLHWGHEFYHYPSPQQIEFAHGVIDAGADIIAGHHPHCVQGVEKHMKKVILYSLGNFFFWNHLKLLGYPLCCNEFIMDACDLEQGRLDVDIVPGKWTRGINCESSVRMMNLTAISKSIHGRFLGMMAGFLGRNTKQSCLNAWKGAA